MFLVALPFVVLGLIPFLFLLGFSIRKFKQGKAFKRVLYGTMFMLALWTCSVFMKAHSLAIDQAGHARRIQENFPAYERSQVFIDIFQIPISYVNWIIDHFRVMLGGTSDYARLLADRASEAWAGPVDFYVWDAAPGAASALVTGVAGHAVRSPFSMAAVVIGLVLIAYYAPALSRWKRQSSVDRWLYESFRKDLEQFRTEGASAERLKSAEEKVAFSKRMLDRTPSLAEALRRRTKAAPIVLNPAHLLRTIYLGERARRSGSDAGAVLGLAMKLVGFVLALVVAYFVSLFGIGFVGLMLVPYVIAAGPIFGLIAALLFAVFLYAGVLRMGGVSFFFMAPRM